MAGTGLELSQDSSGNSTIADQSGADSGAVFASSIPIDADLAAVFEAWPTLPEAIKAGILALVQSQQAR